MLNSPLEMEIVSCIFLVAYKKRYNLSIALKRNILMYINDVCAHLAYVKNKYISLIVGVRCCGSQK